MKKKKNQKRSDVLKQKRDVETLSFLTSWGLKNLYGGIDETFYKLAMVEVDYLAEIGLVQDILSIKSMVDAIKSALNVEPCANTGDFCNSIVALALGIAKHNDIKNMGLPVTWNEHLKKKLLKIFYPEEVRNKIFEWAKENGFNTSTYLGQPIIKFSKVFILIERYV